MRGCSFGVRADKTSCSEAVLFKHTKKGGGDVIKYVLESLISTDHIMLKI